MIDRCHKSLLCSVAQCCISASSTDQLKHKPLSSYIYIYIYIYIWSFFALKPLNFNKVKIIDGIPFYTFSPAHRRVIRDTFICSTIPFLPRALRPWVAIFYPQAFLTLCSFTDILTCVYQGFPGSRQFFHEVYRGSYWWSSKHRPNPSVCLIHSSLQSSYSERSSFKFYYILA